MTAPGDRTPPDYSAESESPRECCANLAMTIGSEAAFYSVNGIRSAKGRLATVPVSDLVAWASRLERAVRRIDEEKRGNL